MINLRTSAAVGIFSIVVNVLTVFSLPVAAEIVVELQAPDWHFVLRQSEHAEREVHMSAVDREFVRQIQSDLQAGNYSLVINAFNAREISTLSPRLKALYGQVLLNEKNYVLAEKVLLDALESTPNSPSVHRSLSMVYLMTGAQNNARKHLTRCVELGIQDAQIFGQLAYANLQLGKPISAISAYQNALMLEPDNQQWYQGLLFALIETNALAQAESLLSEMLLNDENNKQLWLQRGHIALKQGNTVKALSSLETAMSLGDNSLSNLISIAKLHASDGSLRRASDILVKNIATFLTDKNSEGFEAYKTIASYLANQQQWGELERLTKAADEYQNALSPLQIASINVLQAKVAIKKGRSESAIALLTNAIERIPDNGEALLALANLYQQQNKNERAKMMYLRAEALEGVKQQAMLGRAQVAIEQREYQQALQLLRNVYKAFPSRTDLLNNIRTLESLVTNTL